MTELSVELLNVEFCMSRSIMTGRKEITAQLQSVVVVESHRPQVHSSGREESISSSPQLQ